MPAQIIQRRRKRSQACPHPKAKPFNVESRRADPTELKRSWESGNRSRFEGLGDQWLTFREWQRNLAHERRIPQSLSKRRWRSCRQTTCLATLRRRQDLLPDGARSANHHLNPSICWTSVLKSCRWLSSRRAASQTRKSWPRGGDF
jgi:hypothetical protein